MKKLKLGLQLSIAAAFATAIFLGFASFCSFTFTKGAQVQSFTLSAWEMIHGKTADFSAQVLGGSPFLGAMFFIIPLFGLIGCLISKPDVRASVTGVSALVGSVYIYFCNLLVPDAVYYSHALEEVFREHMNPDSVSFALTTSGNILWAVYLLAIICAAATFIVFMLDVKAEYTARKNAPEETVEIEGAIRLDEEEETAFDEIDELNPAV